MMYNHIYEAMVESGGAMKLDREAWVNAQGVITENKMVAVGWKT